MRNSQYWIHIQRNPTLSF